MTASEITVLDHCCDWRSIRTVITLQLVLARPSFFFLKFQCSYCCMFTIPHLSFFLKPIQPPHSQYLFEKPIKIYWTFKTWTAISSYPLLFLFFFPCLIRDLNVNHWKGIVDKVSNKSEPSRHTNLREHKRTIVLDLFRLTMRFWTRC